MKPIVLSLASAVAAVAFVAFAAPAKIESVISEAGPIAIEEVGRGLVHPCGMALLPDGRPLVTERPGGSAS